VKFGIGLAPSVLVVPVREPITLAKQDAYQAHEDNPEVLAIAGTLRGLLAGLDVRVGILDVP
jgi:hypothetical protein